MHGLYCGLSCVCALRFFEIGKRNESVLTIEQMKTFTWNGWNEKERKREAVTMIEDKFDKDGRAQSSERSYYSCCFSFGKHSIGKYYSWRRWKQRRKCLKSKPRVNLCDPVCSSWSWDQSRDIAFHTHTSSQLHGWWTYARRATEIKNY